MERLLIQRLAILRGAPASRRHRYFKSDSEDRVFLKMRAAEQSPINPQSQWPEKGDEVHIWWRLIIRRRRRTLMARQLDDAQLG
jgi:hypothetical protein